MPTRSSIQLARLDQASKLKALSPFSLFSDQLRQMVFGGQQVALRSQQVPKLL
jgi:hypothetical protein